MLPHRAPGRSMQDRLPSCLACTISTCTWWAWPAPVASRIWKMRRTWTRLWREWPEPPRRRASGRGSVVTAGTPRSWPRLSSTASRRCWRADLRCSGATTATRRGPREARSQLPAWGRTPPTLPVVASSAMRGAGPTVFCARAPPTLLATRRNAWSGCHWRSRSARRQPSCWDLESPE